MKTLITILISLTVGVGVGYSIPTPPKNIGGTPIEAPQPTDPDYGTKVKNGKVLMSCSGVNTLDLICNDYYSGVELYPVDMSEK